MISAIHVISPWSTSEIESDSVYGTRLLTLERKGLVHIHAKSFLQESLVTLKDQSGIMLIIDGDDKKQWNEASLQVGFSMIRRRPRFFVTASHDELSVDGCPSFSRLNFLFLNARQLCLVDAGRSSTAKASYQTVLAHVFVQGTSDGIVTLHEAQSIESYPNTLYDPNPKPSNNSCSQFCRPIEMKSTELVSIETKIC